MKNDGTKTFAVVSFKYFSTFCPKTSVLKHVILFKIVACG